MIYRKYEYTVDPLEPFRDLMIAQLGEAGFESFEHTEKGFIGFIPEASVVEDSALDHLEGFAEVKVSFAQEVVEDKNWNEEWESNFEPITIDGKCHIRATFHPGQPDFDYEIVIDPKMSFGTGHHQTTSMMVSLALEIDFEGLDVLDMGAGTAVLAILAGMKNASDITAIDIDEWAYNNALENVALNGLDRIVVKQGGAELLGKATYDLIFANINRNILLEDIPAYCDVLRKGGRLLLSGFYKEDIPAISARCSEFGLVFEKEKNIDNWVALQFKN